jgi:hypothetical protein
MGRNAYGDEVTDERRPGRKDKEQCRSYLLVTSSLMREGCALQEKYNPNQMSIQKQIHHA